MIRRDYILRMIQDFMAILSRLKSLKQDQRWSDADTLIDDEFKRLVGSGSKGVASLSETELLARVITGEPTMVVREKTLMLTRVLKEAGDLAAAQNDGEMGRSCYLKALHLLLQTLSTGEASDWPDFVPKVETLASDLETQAPLPLATTAMLMQHYEMLGDFARAEDMLFAMLEAEPANAAVWQLGENFYQRIKGKTDRELALGNLPRQELESGLNEFRQKAASAKR